MKRRKRRVKRTERPEKRLWGQGPDQKDWKKSKRDQTLQRKGGGEKKSRKAPVNLHVDRG